MKLHLAVLVCFAVAPMMASAQSVCREATAKVIEHREAFTVMKLTLPSRPTPVAATAVIPNSSRPAGGYVFSLSQLVESEPNQLLEMMPAAMDLATEGYPTIVLQRKLTWPEIDKSVGSMESQVLCAQQWLSKHSAVKPDNWTFIGPTEDVPSLEQLHQVGDDRSMTFWWNYSIASSADGQNTESVLHRGIEIVAVTLPQSHD